jgi:hypothetical protein
MISTRIHRALRWIAGAAGLAAGAYGTWVAVAWARYGRVAAPHGDERDPLLDSFMPRYEVAERHHVRVAASAAETMTAAIHADMQQSPLVRSIFRAREIVLGATGGARASSGLLDEVEELGWRVLAHVPDREIVVGAVTQPWLANVVFRGLPPDEFARFDEPGFVKIAWTLRADPDGPNATIFRTETRVITTDAIARRKFRWYWARFSAGILIIRFALLPQVKRMAEGAARAA